MRKLFILIAALILSAISLQAQSFQQSLFLDGYRLGYRYNPALQNESGFLSVGQFENQTRNNFGASSFLYPRDGEVVTALHSSVSADEFLGSLNDDNYFNGSINYNIVSYGWRKGPSYHTLEANVRALYGASIPKEIFAIAKLGTGEKNYDLGGLSAFGNAYVELAYGYSRQLGDFLSIGARAKLLVGIDALRYRLTRFDLSLSGDAYTANLEADLDLSSRWKKIRLDQEGYLNFLDLSSKDRWKLPSGAGLAMDFGVVLTPFDFLTISASIVDLGGIFWYYGNAGASQGTITFNGMQNLTLEDIQEGNIGRQFNGVKDEFLHSLKLKGIDKKTALEYIPFNVNLGVKFELPFYKALSLGATGNYIGMKDMTYREVRGVLAWNPFKWLGIMGNGGTGTYGTVWGCALNVALRQFRLTAGYSDGTGGTIPYSSTPLKPNNKLLTVGLTYDL